jgi:PmbA protein
MIRQFFKLLEVKSKDAGLESVELLYQNSHSFTTKVFRGEIEKYQVSEESGISIRGIYQGKVGYYYSEKIDAAIIDHALNSIKTSAVLIEAGGERIIDEYSVMVDDEDIETLSDRKTVMNTLLKIEQDLKDQYIEIEEVPYNLYADVEGETIILNSFGMDLKQKTKLHYYVLSGLAKLGERSKTAMRIKMGHGELGNVDHLINKVGQEAVDLLQAEPVESGVYDVILRNDVAADLLSAITSIFSGEAIEKGISPLKDRLNKNIGSEKLTIIDDPMNEEALIHRNFDDEGTMTQRKILVKNGKLEQFLHNSRTAEKLDMDRTGNAYRSSIKSLLGISHTNLFIENGASDYAEMVSRMKDGLIIIDIQALHSGLNAISGDFSLPVQAYRVIGGKIQGTVDQITISGNILQMFDALEDVGNDLIFDLPNGMGSVGSPSLYLRNMNISGK